MSDQATPMVRILITLIVSLLCILTALSDIMNGTLTWWAILYVIVPVLTWILVHIFLPDYHWWPNHVEDRVARIREKFDDKECK
jgi:fatty acid desaturase